MALAVCAGALMKCVFGMTPAPLVVLPVNRVLITNLPMANIMDHKPIVNIPPFGMCTSLANPAVAAATAAALEVLTPMPCMPVTISPWIPGYPKVLVAKMQALNNKCKLMCMWAGLIQITTPGQVTVTIP